MTRRVMTEHEAAELSERAMVAVETIAGPGGGVVLLPVVVDGREYLAALVRGDDVARRMQLTQAAIETLVEHLVFLHQQVKGDPNTNPYGVGVAPPSEVLTAGTIAMEVLRHVASGVLLVVHRNKPGADGEPSGGVFAVTNGQTADPDEFRALASLGPDWVKAWAESTVEMLGEKRDGGLKQ